MSVIGDFTVPADSFALREALAAEPDVTVRADRLATHSTMEVLPFLWASGNSLDGFHEALVEDPTVEDVTVAEQAENGVLYKIEWSDEFIDLIDEMVDHHAAIVEAKARGDSWRLKLRFAEDGMVSEFQNYFRRKGRQFEVHQLYHPSGARQREFDLTNDQYDTLLTALREGYFDIPRDTTTDELGELLGISANAVSQRLRRGSHALLENALTIDSESESDEE